MSYGKESSRGFHSQTALQAVCACARVQTRPLTQTSTKGIKTYILLSFQAAPRRQSVPRGTPVHPTPQDTPERRGVSRVWVAATPCHSENVPVMPVTMRNAWTAPSRQSRAPGSVPRGGSIKAGLGTLLSVGVEVLQMEIYFLKRTRRFDPLTCLF